MRLLATHSRSADAALALLVAAFALVSGVDKVSTWGFVATEPWWWYALWALSSGALVVRRTRPLLVAAIAFAAIIAIALAADGVAPPWALLVALYSVGAYQRLGRSLPSTVVIALVLTLVSIHDGQSLRSDWLQVSAMGIVAAFLIGLNVRGRRSYLAAVVDRAAYLEQTTVQNTRLAVAAERARISREIHDVIAHGMSVMISLSDGAIAISETDPARSREVIQQIGDVGRSSLADMRRLLGVLRTDGTDADDLPLGPQPGLAELDALMETYRLAGLPVASRTTGEAPASPSIQLMLYRSVQEALTNALRYSESPSRVLVELSHTPMMSTLQVTDDGGVAKVRPSLGSERGIVGLRERAAMFGGTLAVGPLSTGGWQVRMELPIVPDAEDG